MLPTIEEAKKELEIAEQLNPGPWAKHSLNVGIAARNIAQRVPGIDSNKAYIVGMLYLRRITRHWKNNIIMSATMDTQ